MKISFIDDGLEALCRHSRLSTAKLGPTSAKKLQLRLTELFVAASVRELIAGKPHPLKGARSGQFAVSLHGGDRLVFIGDQSPTPVRTDGSIDWLSVQQIMIIEVGDYHD